MSSLCPVGHLSNLLNNAVQYKPRFIRVDPLPKQGRLLRPTSKPWLANSIALNGSWRNYVQLSFSFLSHIPPWASTFNYGNVPFTPRTKSYPNCLTILSSSFPEFKTVNIFPISFFTKITLLQFSPYPLKRYKWIFSVQYPNVKLKKTYLCLKSFGMGCNEDKSGVFLLQKEGTHGVPEEI